MSALRSLRGWLALVAALALAGCGGGGSGGAATAGVSAALARYFDALRRGDLAGVRASLAPDYNYDRGSGLFDPANPFDRPFGVRYRTLDARIDRLAAAGETVTAEVTTEFAGIMNLEPIGLGRPDVTGRQSLALEARQRGGEWKLTAVRAVREQSANPRFGSTVVAAIPAYVVNSLTSLEVLPGTRLFLIGTADVSTPLQGAPFLATVRVHLGSAFAQATLKGSPQEPWELLLQAPDAPGRFLAHALLLTFVRDSASGSVQFVAEDHRTVPVTVVSAP